MRAMSVKVVAVRVFFLFAAMAAMVTCRPIAHSGAEQSLSGLTAAEASSQDIGLFKAGNRNGSTIRDHYLDDVQPILASRCAACHNCSDAPCQLKLTSHRLVMRGASKELVYDRKRIRGAQPTRDFDALSALDWQQNKGFFPVVVGDGHVSQRQSLLGMLVEHGKANQPGFDLATAQNLREARLNFTFSCPENPAELQKWVAAHPGSGMPLGLPAMSSEENGIIEDWLASGVVGPGPAALIELYTPKNPTVITQWEDFLNGPSAKEKHVARYIYEHAYQAHLHFDESPGEFFRIVRSKVSSGYPVLEITTELPNQDPQGVFFYRLKKVEEVIGKKTHFVWELNQGKMDSFRSIFLNKPWPAEAQSGGVSAPSYKSQNPFEYFEQIPAEARWVFLRKNAKMIVDSFLQTEVCVGSVPLFVVMDQFWLWFMEGPDDPSVVHPKLGLKNWESHWSRESQSALASAAARIQSDFESISLAQLPMPGTTRYKRDSIYRNALETTLREMHPDGLKSSDIWNGDGDKNAFITVLRHGTNGTAVYGATGSPQSIIVFSYSMFERMYYDLVLNFKYWGSAVHKMTTWNYMNGLRVEGEDLFLSFLPEDQRKQLRGRWSRGLLSLAQKAYHPMLSEGRPTLVRRFGSVEETLSHFVAEVTGSMTPNVIDPGATYASWAKAAPPEAEITNNAEWEAGLRSIADHIDTAQTAMSAAAQPYAHLMPSLSLVKTEFSPQIYSIVANRGYQFHSLKLAEDKARDPARDYLSLYKGTAGAVANMFFYIPNEKPDVTNPDRTIKGPADFISRIKKMRTEADRIQLFAYYGVNRNDGNFWSFYDDLHRWIAKNEPLSGGIIDLAKYDIAVTSDTEY